MVLPMIQRATDGPAEPARAVRRARRDGEGRGAAAARGDQDRARRLRRRRDVARRQGRHALLLHAAAGAEAAEGLSRARRADLKKIGVDGADGFMGNAIALARARGRLRRRRARADAEVRCRPCRRSSPPSTSRAVEEGRA